MTAFQKIYRSQTVQYLAMVLFAILLALNYELFVFPNNFAPSGINGLATMVQHLFNFNVGYLSLIINIPMLAVAFFVVNRDFAAKNLVFVVVFSIANIFFRSIDLSQYAFIAKDGGDAILAAIAAGFFNGVFYSVTFRCGGSTGGVDIIAAFIHEKKPAYDMVWLIFILNASVAVLSFFVYGMNYSAVILCLTYAFVTGIVTDKILKGAHSAAKFEVITPHPEELAQELMSTLKHGCTMIEAEGMYTHSGVSMLVCVVNRHQIVAFEHIIEKYDHTFAYISTVNKTFGRFTHVK